VTAHRDGAVWKTSAKKEFEKWAETYDQSVLQRILFRRCYMKFIELIVKNYDVAPGQAVEPMTLLDIGCGTGTFATMLGQIHLPIRPVGLDMAERMCQIATEKTMQLGLNGKVTFVVADSEHIPMPDGAFDIVTCSNSFHHYPHQLTVLKEMRRVLKPGGRLIVLDGFRDNVIGWFVFDVCVTRAEGAVHHCSAAEMRTLYAEAGFVDTWQEKFGLWAPVLATMGRKPAV